MVLELVAAAIVVGLEVAAAVVVLEVAAAEVFLEVVVVGAAGFGVLVVDENAPGGNVTGITRSS